MTVCDRCKAEIVVFEGYTMLLMKRDHSWIPPEEACVSNKTAELCNKCAVMIDKFVHSTAVQFRVTEPSLR